jgi:hypothetical protein
MQESTFNGVGDAESRGVGAAALRRGGAGSAALGDWHVGSRPQQGILVALTIWPKLSWPSSRCPSAESV